MGSPFVYVGSGFYDIPNPQLYVFRLDESTGALTEMQKTSVDASPSFIAITPDSRFLYLNIENTPTSAVAFQIEPGGLLKKLNSAENGSNGSAYISTDRSGRFVLQANYETGSAAVIATNSDGSLGDVVDEKDLGESAFPHSIVVDPTNQFAFVANRSGDYIAQFRFDAETGALEKNDAATVEAPPGTGPRHLVFHPQAPYAYVNNERNSTVTRYAYDAVAGTLTEKDQVSTVPAGQTGRNAPADMRIHPNGKFLYVANRGHYSIARFLVNAESGELTAAGHEIFEGEPRNLFIDPNGRFLVVGNMGLGNVLVYAIDAETGALTLRGTPTPVASPSGIAIAYSAAQ